MKQRKGLRCLFPTTELNRSLKAPKGQILIFYGSVSKSSRTCYFIGKKIKNKMLIELVFMLAVYASLTSIINIETNRHAIPSNFV